MKAIKCFITYKSVVIDDVTIAINPPLSIEEFTDDIALFRSQSEELSEHRIREFGTRLFQRVFTGSALDRYREKDPAAIALAVSSELAVLPWELLHDGTDWVARARGVVRVATTGRSAPEIIPKAGNLRILAVIAGPVLDETLPDDDPNQIHPIDINAHAEIFQKIEGEPFPAEVKIRKHITREILSWEMSENYHILHFVGHGNIGRLAFETRHATLDLAEEDWIREQITVGLRGNLRLVVINSCHSADENADIQGVAETILGTGVPAVIAMQGEVSELADLVLMRNFYGALARGKPIDEAVMGARRAIATDWQTNAYDWAIPVLFVNDSLLEKEVSLSLMDAEMVEMLIDPKVKIAFPPQAPLDIVMTREQKFVGRRQELNNVLLSLDPERRDSVQIVCLHGEGGIGKTTIAIEAVHRMAGWFKEIIWLSGRSAVPGELREHVKSDDPLVRISSADGFLMALARKCGFELKGDETAIQLRDGILKTLSGNRWKLLLLDSMEELIKSDAIRSLLTSLPPNCKALITSREFLEINERQIHITPMKKPDSLRLLTTYGHIKGVQANLEELSEIVHFTGGHPMAMRLVISQVTSAEKTLATALKDLRKAKGIIFDYIFNSSLKLALKDGRRLFSAMALFYPTASRRALQEVCRLNDDAFSRAIKRIVGLSLVESYQQGRRFGLHQLARAKAERQLMEDQDKERYRENMAEFFMEFASVTAPMTQPAIATQALEAQMPAGTPKDQIQEVAMQVLVKPALEMLETELFNCLSVLEWAINKGDLNMATKLLENLGEFLTRRGYWNEAMHYLIKIAEGWRDRGEHHDEAIILRNLGMMYDRQGKLKDAITCYENALKVAQKSKDKALEAHALDGLGTAYAEQGEWDKASKYFKYSQEIFHSLGNEIEEAGVLNNLGVLYRQTNRWQEAAQIFEGVRTIFERLNEKLGEAIALGNLGECYRNGQQYENAGRCYEKSLKIFKDLGDKEGQKNELNSLGLLYEELGNLDLAMDCYQNSLEIAREIDDRIGQQVTLRNIAIVCGKQKNWLKAVNACIESFQIAVQIHSSVVMDSLKCILIVSKYMFRSREFIMPAQLVAQLSQFLQGIEVPDDEMRAALAISHGVLTIIGFIAVCEWDKASTTYKEALELAHSLDESTEKALRLVEWLEQDNEKVGSCKDIVKDLP